MSPRSIAITGIEILIIIIWALYVGRTYLNFDPRIIPTGREYISAIQSHQVWATAQECGLCAMWNGSIRGGAPAFVDVYGSLLHPLVIVMTLGWGVLNGAKLVLVTAFMVAGLAQWRLARELELGRVARVWSGCMAVTAGHLAGRMDIGVFGIVLSTASCALVLPALIRFVRASDRRAAVILAVALALTFVAGQGYMQIGLVFTFLAVPLLLFGKRDQFMLLVRRGGIALGLAFMLASLFLVPFLHFLPQFVKDSDPGFTTAQPFAYIPLNLVIDDPSFYRNDALQKEIYPYLNTIYIGWIPVLLAIWAVGRGRSQRERWMIAFLVVSAVLAFWFASAMPLRWLSEHAPTQWLSEQFVGIRNPALISGLAVPPLLALAAIGLDILLGVSWARLRLTASTNTGASLPFVVDGRWLLAIPLVMALASAQQFSQNWLTVMPIDPVVDDVISALETPDLQWVNTPFGEHFWMVDSVAQHLKLGIGIRTWNWRDRPLPAVVLEASRGEPAPGMIAQQTINELTIAAAPPGSEYAAVTHADGSRTVCTAHGVGGNIDVQCTTPQPGILQVEENSWSGWNAQLDSQAVPLLKERWLAVELPAGTHTLAFRYRPWDVALGALLTLCGIILAVYLWTRVEVPSEVVQEQPRAGLAEA